MTLRIPPLELFMFCIDLNQDYCNSAKSQWPFSWDPEANQTKVKRSFEDHFDFTTHDTDFSWNYSNRLTDYPFSFVQPITWYCFKFQLKLDRTLLPWTPPLSLVFRVGVNIIDILFIIGRPYEGHIINRNCAVGQDVFLCALVTGFSK